MTRSTARGTPGRQSVRPAASRQPGGHHRRPRHPPRAAVGARPGVGALIAVALLFMAAIACIVMAWRPADHLLPGSTDWDTMFDRYISCPVDDAYNLALANLLDATAYNLGAQPAEGRTRHPGRLAAHRPGRRALAGRADAVVLAAPAGSKLFRENDNAAVHSQSGTDAEQEAIT